MGGQAEANCLFKNEAGKRQWGRVENSDIFGLRGTGQSDYARYQSSAVKAIAGLVEEQPIVEAVIYEDFLAKADISLGLDQDLLLGLDAQLGVVALAGKQGELFVQKIVCEAVGKVIGGVESDDIIGSRSNGSTNDAILLIQLHHLVFIIEHFILRVLGRRH